MGKDGGRVEEAAIGMLHLDFNIVELHWMAQDSATDRPRKSQPSEYVHCIVSEFQYPATSVTPFLHQVRIPEAVRYLLYPQDSLGQLETASLWQS